MKHPVLIFTFTILTICLPALALGSPNMQPGNWEITSTIEMPGMTFSMPASKHTQCISSEEMIPQAQQENDKCQILENQLHGDTLTWKIECESEGGVMTSRGKIVYHGATFDGTIHTTGSQLPSGMTQQMTGKRIGNCP